MKQIEKPDWAKITKGGISMPTNARLDSWFIHAVEPINEALAAGVEVYETISAQSEPFWFTELRSNNIQNKKALLINIKPLKVESPADVLRSFVGARKIDLPSGGVNIKDYYDLIDRAQAALKNETDRGE